MYLYCIDRDECGWTGYHRASDEEARPKFCPSCYDVILEYDKYTQPVFHMSASYEAVLEEETDYPQ